MKIIKVEYEIENPISFDLSNTDEIKKINGEIDKYFENVYKTGSFSMYDFFRKYLDFDIIKSSIPLCFKIENYYLKLTKNGISYQSS